MGTITERLERILKAAGRFRSNRQRRSWQVAHKIADDAVPKMVSTLLLEVRGVRKNINVARLSRAIASGNMAEIEATLLLPDLDKNLRRKYQKQMFDTLNRAGVASVKLQPKVLAGVFGRFDITNPRAVEWARQRSGTLIAEDVLPSFKRTIRTVIADGIRDGVPVRQTARRVRQSIGLTETQWRSVANFQNKQVARGVSLEAARAKADRFSLKVLRRRALTIARTETIASGFQGRQELWDQASDKGLIDKTAVKRTWIVTPDDRLDELICEPMAGQSVGLEEMFVTGLGDTVEGPPAHPSCRCDVILNIPGRSLFA